MSKLWDREVREHTSPKGILGEHESASARPPAGSCVDGPDGHRVDTNRQESGFGRVYAQTHLPYNGTNDSDPPKPYRLFESHMGDGSGRSGNSSAYGIMGALPKMHFPKFDGDSPRL